MKVLPLGISSAVPTRERNMAATALVFEGLWLLIDCGEGTQHRLMHSGLRTSQLDAVLITHMHGDHVLGLPGLLSTMGMQNRVAPLFIYGPPGIKSFLKNVLSASFVYLSFDLQIHEVIKGSIRQTSHYEISCLPLNHVITSIGYCVQERHMAGSLDRQKIESFGLRPGPEYGLLKKGKDVLWEGKVIRSSEVVGPPKPGRRFVYCGDTRPCENAVILAEDADLLMHESTYTSDLEKEAGERGHSTARQAAQIASRAKVKALLINHFSTRYLDADPLLNEAREIFPSTFAAAELTPFEIRRPEPSIEAGTFSAAQKR